MIIDSTLADVDPLRAALRADIRAGETAIARRLAAESRTSRRRRSRVDLPGPTPSPVPGPS